MKISSFADANLAVPTVIRRLAGDSSIVPVWANGDGGVTFHIRAVEQSRFVKWAPAESFIDLAAELKRLRWAGAFAPVPRVLDFAITTAGTYLLTAALPGETAITDHWKAHPAQAVQAADVGLRALHDSLPVEDCPFDWSIATVLELLLLVRRISCRQDQQSTPSSCAMATPAYPTRLSAHVESSSVTSTSAALDLATDGPISR